MRNKKLQQFRVMQILSVMVFILIPSFFAQAETNDEPSVIAGIEQEVQELMDEGDIPGLALVIIRAGEPDVIKGFGTADQEKKIPVTRDTRFELASCSKSFTALAALRLAQQGRLNLDEPVSFYLPWFSVKYKGKREKITLRQALNHTTGIPWNSVGGIPMGNDKDALEQTVKSLVGRELESKPGARFRYATINYDIIGHIIEKVSGMSYETYMETHVFSPLGLEATTVGMDRVTPGAAGKKATGYKIGFFAPRRYKAPPYRGNSPAGYIVSTAGDMARWLKLQMGLVRNPWTPLIEKTQRKDETVKPDLDELSYYAMGWQVSITGDGEIRHGGNNPNFTAQVNFLPGKKIGVAVLANSDSNYTSYIGRTVMNMIQGEKKDKDPVPQGGMDKNTSVISIILGIFILGIIAYIVSIGIDLLKGRRRWEALTWKKTGKMVLAIPILGVYLLGVYLLPSALGGVSWSFAQVWSPISFQAVILLLLVCVGAGYSAYVLSLFFPQQNKYLKSIPHLSLLSVLSGCANAVIIFLVTASLYTEIKLFYMLFYFGLVIALYLVGGKIVETELTKITYDIVYDLRMKLIGKVFHTSYQKFEKLDRGRILTTINDDVSRVGNSAGAIVSLLTNLITIAGVFLYLSTIALWVTLVTLGVMVFIALIYAAVSQKAEMNIEEARETGNVFLRLLKGMIDGFKELSIHFNKKKEYSAEVEKSTDEYRKKSVFGLTKFINAFIIGESMLVVTLGAVAFVVPRVFTDIRKVTIMSFIMVLLYLIGPINNVLTSIPTVVKLKVSWKRVQGFLKDIPANLNGEALEKLEVDVKHVDRIEAKGVVFEYEQKNGDKPFRLGPIDFKAQKGEIVFIVGGNGSGKTTLAKLLTGLYTPGGGIIEVDGKAVNNYQLGEYYSTVFSDYYLFENLYNVDFSKGDKREEAEKYLKVLRLQEKVSFKEDGTFSTIELSGGQRKRLALLQCYLEDCPIYLFDEVAADQDPEFRRFFYRDLLIRMKEKGKIVIAVTHDDHYFDVADKVIKMEMGKIDTAARLQKGMEENLHLNATPERVMEISG